MATDGTPSPRATPPSPRPSRRPWLSQARSRPTISDRNGAIRLPAGTSITAHTLRNATITSSPYTGARAFRGAGTRRGPSASRNALRAWSRCHPVSSHNSSRTLALTARDDDRYRVAVAFVTALRWLIVSPMSEAGRSQQETPPPRRRRAFLHEATIPATRASLVSQLASLTRQSLRPSVLNKGRLALLCDKVSCRDTYFPSERQAQEDRMERSRCIS